MKAAQHPAKKPVSSYAAACIVPDTLGSKFARMLLPAPWVEEFFEESGNKPSILERLKMGLRRLFSPADTAADAPQVKYRLMRVAPGRAITDFYGCQYHVGRDGSLRLGVRPENGHVPADLYDDAGKLLFGRARRFVLRKAKLLVQRFERRAFLRGEPSILVPAAACA